MAGVAEKENYIKFLGTAGARFVMIKQLRASGGLWVSYEGTNILIDPGPGSLVRCALSRPRLDPAKLDGIILTHRHLDHSNDLNVMIEAMTEGAFVKKGIVFLPGDAMEENSLILPHLRNMVEGVEILEAKRNYAVKNIKFSVPARQKHSVLTYGLKFSFQDKNKRKYHLSLISDTGYYAGLEDMYDAQILIINVVFLKERPGVEHLHLEQAKQIIAKIKPRTAILTHFGMTMVKAKPHLLAQQLTEELGIEVLAAYDGMKLPLTTISS